MATDPEAIGRAFRTHDFLVSRHALDRIRERGISLPALVEAIGNGQIEVIEDYPRDPRGASCLLWCQLSPAHIVHAQVSAEAPVWVITAYEPDPQRWDDTLKRRRS